MPEENDFHVFEIAVGDFDLNLIPAEARSPGTEKFEAAVKNFYEDQLRKIAVNYTIGIETSKIRVTWRKSSILMAVTVVVLAPSLSSSGLYKPLECGEI